MRVRAITSTGDFTYGAGQSNYLLAKAAAAQAIGTDLMMFLGDCFFATNEGIDWWTFLGGSKSQLALELTINAVILNVQSQGVNVVSNINSVVVSLNSVTRVFSVTYDVTTIFGNVQNVVNINLGVGPLAPPVSNLLPQFNQVLLNNVSATAVVGAMFSSSVFWEVDLSYFIERRDATPHEYTQRGTLRCVYGEESGLWTITDNIFSGSSGPTTGVTFSINSSTGQVYYASDNMAGGSYVGNLILQSTNQFAAGL